MCPLSFPNRLYYAVKRTILKSIFVSSPLLRLSNERRRSAEVPNNSLRKGLLSMPRFFRLTKCPYCHRKISYTNASFLKTKGEYTCENCKCISNVVINKTLYAIASIICVLALVIVLIYSSVGDHGSLWGLFLVLIPFILFYVIVPFFIRLEPCKEKSAVKKAKEKELRNLAAETTEQHSKIKENTEPIELDVSSDFTAKFMKTKINAENVRPEMTEEEKQAITDLTGETEMEDIQSSTFVQNVTEKAEEI